MAFFKEVGTTYLWPLFEISMLFWVIYVGMYICTKYNHGETKIDETETETETQAEIEIEPWRPAQKPCLARPLSSQPG